MDVFGEYFKGRLLIAAIILFIAAAFLSWNEMRYLAFGQKTDAKITKVMLITSRGRWGTERRRFEVHYTFTEQSGAVRLESDRMSEDWRPDAAGTAEVQYIPGVTDKSRIAGHAQWWAPILFFGTLAFLGYKLWDALRDFREYEAAKKRSEAY